MHVFKFVKNLPDIGHSLAIYSANEVSECFVQYTHKELLTVFEYFPQPQYIHFQTAFKFYYCDHDSLSLQRR